MKKSYAEVIAGVTIAGLSGAPKSAGVTADHLRSGAQQSSLDALRRGDSLTTPRDSAVREIYFAFNRYDLDTEDRATLRTNAEWLKKNHAARIEIEGHCDERGTTEYNLALGAKRAQAAKDYLISLGVSANRISTKLRRGDSGLPISGGRLLAEKSPRPVRGGRAAGPHLR